MRCRTATSVSSLLKRTTTQTQLPTITHTRHCTLSELSSWTTAKVGVLGLRGYDISDLSAWHWVLDGRHRRRLFWDGGNLQETAYPTLSDCTSPRRQNLRIASQSISHIFRSCFNISQFSCSGFPGCVMTLSTVMCSWCDHATILGNLFAQSVVLYSHECYL